MHYVIMRSGIVYLCISQPQHHIAEELSGGCLIFDGCHGVLNDGVLE
jgi:hypothetical protein